MRLESITKYFFPKSCIASDSPRATVSDSLTGTDIMAALGLADLKSGFGLELFLAKLGISNPDSAVESLTQYALKESVKYKAISRLDEDIKQSVVQTLARYAFADYARSAASVRECECCKGTGVIEADVFTMKSHYTMRLPQFAKDFGQSPSDFEVRREVGETVRLLCKPCGGKGVVSNSCRCNGKGTVLDKEKTEMSGIPVYKTCGKCSGRGYSRVPAETVRKAIFSIGIDVPRQTWSKSWKPFYDALISKCHAEESAADAKYSDVTR